MERPECYEFGMEFMGDPEESIIRHYVEWLENRIRELEAAQQTVAVDVANAATCKHIFDGGLYCIHCGEALF